MSEAFDTPGKEVVSDELTTLVYPPIDDVNVGFFDITREVMTENFIETLNEFVRKRMNFKSIRYASKGCYNPFKVVDTSMDKLSTLIDDYCHLAKPSLAGDENVNVYTFNKHPHQMFDVCIKFQEIYSKLSTGDKEKVYYLPQRFHYMPPGGTYGWNNIINPGNGGIKMQMQRDITYLFHCEEEHKTIIKYLKGDDIYEVEMPKGWSAYQVKVGTWHCIESHTNTLMMAFKPTKQDKIGFCNENHYAADKFPFKNFSAGNSDVEKINEINAFFTSMQIAKDLNTGFLDRRFFSLPLKYIDHVQNFVEINITDIQWDGKDAVEEYSGECDESVKECVKRHSESSIITVLNVSHAQLDLRCMYGHHILSEIFAKHKTAERKYLEDYEKSLSTEDPTSNDDELTLPVTQLSVRVVGENDLQILQQQRYTQYDEGYHEVSPPNNLDEFTVHIPIKEVIYREPTEEPTQEPAQEPEQKPEQEQDSPRLLPDEICNYLKDEYTKSGEGEVILKGDMKEAVLEYAYECFTKGIMVVLCEWLQSELRPFVDIRLKLIDSNKDAFVTDEKNNKEIFIILTNLSESSQYIEFPKLAAMMNKDVKLETAESCSYWPCSTRENYCTDSMHKRRHIGKGFWLETTLILKEEAQCTLRTIIRGVENQLQERKVKEIREGRLDQMNPGYLIEETEPSETEPNGTDANETEPNGTDANETEPNGTDANETEKNNLIQI